MARETAGLRVWEELPPRAQGLPPMARGSDRVRDLAVSTGPGRDETIIVEPSRLTRWFDLRPSLP